MGPTLAEPILEYDRKHLGFSFVPWIALVL